MIQLDDDPKFIYIIGGCQNGIVSNKTWIVNLENYFLINEGPSLNIPRCGHSSAKFKLNGKEFIVVAGGKNEDSVELLEVSAVQQVWQKGKNRISFFCVSYFDKIRKNSNFQQNLEQCDFF